MAMSENRVRYSDVSLTEEIMARIAGGGQRRVVRDGRQGCLLLYSLSIASHLVELMPGPGASRRSGRNLLSRSCSIKV
jgi:hypothetical protein